MGSSGDGATHDSPPWFFAKQADEEAALRDIDGPLRAVGNDPSGVLLTDRELGS
jgi:ferritin